MPGSHCYFLVFLSSGFQLLEKVLGKSAFYGKGHPQYIITDNRESERRILKELWPDSEQYLSTFHILQQVN